MSFKLTDQELHDAERDLNLFEKDVVTASCVARHARSLLSEVKRLHTTEAMYDAFRGVDLPAQDKELLVRCAFEAAEISHGRAAELLGIPLWEFRERGWVQGKWEDEIEALKKELSKHHPTGRDCPDCGQRPLVRIPWAAASACPDCVLRERDHAEASVEKLSREIAALECQLKADQEALASERTSREFLLEVIEDIRERLRRSVAG